MGSGAGKCDFVAGCSKLPIGTGATGVLINRHSRGGADFGEDGYAGEGDARSARAISREPAARRGAEITGATPSIGRCNRRRRARHRWWIATRVSDKSLARQAEGGHRAREREPRECGRFGGGRPGPTGRCRFQATDKPVEPAQPAHGRRPDEPGGTWSEKGRFPTFCIRAEKGMGMTMSSSQLRARGGGAYRRGRRITWARGPQWSGTRR